MSGYDYGVVAIYLAFICSLGLVFRRFSKNSSDYFVGGGNVLWWLVGATAFMSQFSAWTFTGAASKAYTDGLMVTVLFLGNAIGYFVAYRWSAAKYRQMRVVTPMEGVRDRFGRANEQFFTWIWLPIGILYAGIWLNAVSKFVSVVFAMNLQLTIVIVGFVVVFVAAIGGAWAVVASDFMQMLILMAMSVFAAFLSVRAVGHGSFGEGLTSFVGKLPKNHLDWTALLRPQVVVLWVVAALVKQFCTTNNLNDSNRFLFSRDSRAAKSAALLASILFVVGPLLWFIPPMAAAILYPDLSVIPELKPLGSKITDGAYVAIGLRTMPMGMIGLMVSAIFAATMSNMDTGLNKNAGIFVRNFYKPILRPSGSEKEYLLVGKTVSVFFGALVVAAALGFESIQGLGLFDIMMLFSSMIAIPYLIPLIWGIVIKRTPSWSAWSTVLVGFTVSLLTSKYLPPETVRKLIGLATPFRPQEVEDYKFFTSLFLNVGVSSLWFLFTTLFARYNSPAYTAQEKAFFERINTPVVSRPEDTRVMDRAQLRTLGLLGIPYGSFVVLLALIPNPLTGRLGFVLSGGIIVFISWILYRASTRIVIPAATAAATVESAPVIEARPSA
jgi:SSS family solute:Na+ symporter